MAALVSRRRSYFQFLASAGSFVSSSASIGEMQALWAMESRADLAAKLDRLTSRCARALKDDWAECFVAGTQVVVGEGNAVPAESVAARYDGFYCIVFVGAGLVAHGLTRRRKRRQNRATPAAVDLCFAASRDHERWDERSAADNYLENVAAAVAAANSSTLASQDPWLNALGECLSAAPVATVPPIGTRSASIGRSRIIDSPTTKVQTEQQRDRSVRMTHPIDRTWQHEVDPNQSHP